MRLANQLRQATMPTELDIAGSKRVIERNVEVWADADGIVRKTSWSGYRA